MTWRRPVLTICSDRSSCRAWPTASRDAPVQAASSSWESGDHPQDHQRDARVVFEERGERGARNQQGIDGLSVVDGARARLRVDRCHLAQQVAGARAISHARGLECACRRAERVARRNGVYTTRLISIATVMFTDLEGSTETTTRLGDDEAAGLFAQHDRIVRDAIAVHGGRQVRSTGDGFLVLFDSARSGVACALAIDFVSSLQREDGLRVRIGIGAGEVQEGEGELSGAAINLAARAMDRANGGQVLVTDAVRQLVGTIPGVRFRDRGPCELEGLPRAPAPARGAAGRGIAEVPAAAPQVSAPDDRRRGAGDRADRAGRGACDDRRCGGVGRSSQQRRDP